jgi:hypothetical protein
VFVRDLNTSESTIGKMGKPKTKEPSDCTRAARNRAEAWAPGSGVPLLSISHEATPSPQRGNTCRDRRQQPEDIAIRIVQKVRRDGGAPLDVCDLPVDHPVTQR